MTGFDIWTSGATPEKIARLMSLAPCVACADICPFYGNCNVSDTGIKWVGIDVSKQCYMMLCMYFNKETDERDN